MVRAKGKRGEGVKGLAFEAKVCGVGAVPGVGVGVVEVGDGAYRIEVPREGGGQQLGVTLGGQHVRGSPCDVPSTLAWDVARSNPKLVFTKDARVATYGGWGDWLPCIATVAVDAFAVRVTRGGGGQPWSLIGLIDAAAYTCDGPNNKKAGARAILLGNGALHGAGKHHATYTTRIASGSVVRCVRDRAAGTVRFVVDGVDRGVAFDHVPDGPLFPYADCCPGNNESVELV